MCPRPTLLVQLHWQERLEPHRTEFVAQGEFDSGEAMHAWANEIIERRRAECPDDWSPMICTEDAPEFVRCAASS